MKYPRVVIKDEFLLLIGGREHFLLFVTRSFLPLNLFNDSLKCGYCPVEKKKIKYIN